MGRIFPGKDLRATPIVMITTAGVVQKPVRRNSPPSGTIRKFDKIQRILDIGVDTIHGNDLRRRQPSSHPSIPPRPPSPLHPPNASP